MRQREDIVAHISTLCSKRSPVEMNEIQIQVEIDTGGKLLRDKPSMGRVVAFAVRRNSSLAGAPGKTPT